MKQFTPKSVALFTLSSGVMALMMQACGGGGDAHAQAATPIDPIVGLWQSSVSLNNCSGVAVGGFRGLTTLQQGGTALADNNQPSATKGPAMGTWKAGATAGSYVVSLRFWRYLADGTPAGQQRLTRTITLSADGQSLTSTITTQALDNADNVVQSACGTETAARIG